LQGKYFSSDTVENYWTELHLSMVGNYVKKPFTSPYTNRVPTKTVY